MKRRVFLGACPRCGGPSSVEGFLEEDLFGPYRSCLQSFRRGRTVEAKPKEAA